jgi:hypothetical protein
MTDREDDDFFVPAVNPSSSPMKREVSAPIFDDGTELNEMVSSTHELAARKLLKLTPTAIDTIEEIITDDTVAASVRQKAAADVLDRVGLKQSIKVEVAADVTVSPSEILADRLAQLSTGAAVQTVIAGELVDSDTNDIEDTPDTEEEIIDVTDGEIEAS